MLKKILRTIQKLENNKQVLLQNQKEIQIKIDKADADLKKANSLKKEYEKLEKNVSDFLNPS